MSDEIGWLRKVMSGDCEPPDLCDELEVAKIKVAGTWMIKHRFFDTAEYEPEHNAWYNEQLETRRARAEQFKADKQWWEYVDAHAKEHYPAILEEIKGCTTQVEWCHAVRSAWYLSDVLWINRDAWLRIFSDRARIAGISEKAEHASFTKQADPLTVYRGCLPEHVDGLSWSLSNDAAEHFKLKAGYRGVVFSGIVAKAHVLAYMSPNNEEFEVVVPPETRHCKK